MREIAQPYHANLDKGGRMFAQWAGLEQRYVLQLNQGDSSKQVSLIKGLLTNGTSTLEWQMAGKGRSEMRHLVCVRFHAGRASCAREILSRQVNRSPESGERAG